MLASQLVNSLAPTDCCETDVFQEEHMLEKAWAPKTELLQGAERKKKVVSGKDDIMQTMQDF
jgi:hypothetical protein